jgi:VWFA-related protein
LTGQSRLGLLAGPLEMQASPEKGRPGGLPYVALLFLCGTVLPAQPTIHVPVRLVSVPTLVLAPDGHTLPDLQPADFRLFDSGRPQTFTLDTSVNPISVVIAVQANQDIRAYLPFIARTGSALDALLVGASGESAAIFYGDDVAVVKPFDGAELSPSFRSLAPKGKHARTIDAGLRAIDLLRQRPPSRSRVLLFIGQPSDHGSESHLDDLRREAERENVTIHALALPEIGAAFVSDTFAIRGLSSRLDRGGFRADVNLTRLIPVLSRAAASIQSSDPFSLLTAATGGTQFHFRTQAQLEDAIAIVGVELRSAYTLSFVPSGETGYHPIRVETTVAGSRIYARPGYWLASN